MSEVKKLIAEARVFDTAPAPYATRLRGAHSLIGRLADALEALDSAPPVARSLPDREALADAIELALDPVEFELVRHGTLGSLAYRAADAALAAIEKGGERNDK